MAQRDYDGLEHGVLKWQLPPKHAPVSRDHYKPQTKEEHQFGVGVRQHGIKSPPSSAEVMGQTRRSRARNQSNWATSVPGMQAIFLGSSPKTSGTGVFIPRKDGTEFSKKPPFSPVLLPSRVVQALNLNVHELGKHVKHKPEHRKDTMKKPEENDPEENNEADVICISPDIFLPKEWTY